jgi:hypothetical protein
VIAGKYADVCILQPTYKLLFEGITIVCPIIVWHLGNADIGYPGLSGFAATEMLARFAYARDF